MPEKQRGCPYLLQLSSFVFVIRSGFRVILRITRIYGGCGKFLFIGGKTFGWFSFIIYVVSGNAYMGVAAVVYPANCLG